MTLQSDYNTYYKTTEKMSKYIELHSDCQRIRM